jgi:hypothetical protein
MARYLLRRHHAEPEAFMGLPRFNTLSTSKAASARTYSALAVPVYQHLYLAYVMG